MLSPLFLRTIGRAQLFLTALLVAAALALDTWLASAIALGGLFMAGNFWLMRVLAARVLSSGNPRLAYIVALGLKFVVVLAAIGGIMWLVQPDPVGFSLGLFTLLVAIGASVLRAVWAPTLVKS